MFAVPQLRVSVFASPAAGSRQRPPPLHGLVQASLDPHRPPLLSDVPCDQNKGLTSVRQRLASCMFAFPSQCLGGRFHPVDTVIYFTSWVNHLSGRVTRPSSAVCSLTFAEESRRRKWVVALWEQFKWDSPFPFLLDWDLCFLSNKDNLVNKRPANYNISKMAQWCQPHHDDSIPGSSQRICPWKREVLFSHLRCKAWDGPGGGGWYLYFQSLCDSKFTVIWL